MPKAAPAKTAPAKKAKDPNAPKRALSAFMFFSTENRPKVLEDNPDIKFGEIGKELGARWKSLTPAQKGPYEKKAEADKERYAKAKAAYDKGLAAPAKKPTSKKAAPPPQDDDDDDEDSD